MLALISGGTALPKWQPVVETVKLPGNVVIRNIVPGLVEFGSTSECATWTEYYILSYLTNLFIVQ